MSFDFNTPSSDFAPVQPINPAAPAAARGFVPAPGQSLPERTGLYDPANERDNCGVGFIANIKGKKSHSIITDAIEMLSRMDHRGACGCEDNTGDGAGILTALPSAFLTRAARDDAGIKLPEPGRFGAGVVFLPRDKAQREAAKKTVGQIVQRAGQTMLGWRVLPTDTEGADVGPTARRTEPVMEMLFVGAADGVEGEAFERKLYLIRKAASREVRGGGGSEKLMFYICSLSTKVMVYKGQLLSTQVMPYYPDLQDERYVSHLAMVHSRFSTNTFPSWDRAQPCRFMSHNGEINTVQGNRNWFAARQGLMRSELFGDELNELLPIVEPDVSDSGTFDNALELLLMAGRSLPEAVMMMIPEAWESHESMPVSKRAFYEFHANLMEPWDGPASVSFTDGKYIGAVLDRNGLRPSRYYVTHDDRVIMASEVGVVDVDPTNVKIKGRLQPGRMFLVDFDQGRIISDDEVKQTIVTRRPYGQWLQEKRIVMSDLRPDEHNPQRVEPEDLLPALQSFGYTTEHLNMLLVPMVRDSKEALGSMGNDSALAVLSDEPRLVYDYFKQLFAQVTNPPIDPIREECIMSLQSWVGPEGNLLETTEAQCHRLNLSQPILRNEELAAIKHMNHRGWKSKVIDITFEARDPGEAAGAASPGVHVNANTNGNGRRVIAEGVGPDQSHHPEARAPDPASRLTAALDRVCEEASRAIADGYPVIVLSDRAACRERAPLPSLLAMGAVHHHLIARHDRTKIGIVLETGEAREVHHFALLAGYGADAINPYLAFESIWHLRREGVLDQETDEDDAIDSYIKAIGKGMLKVMSKMGISTLASYKGAQIFECVGLNQSVINRCFTGTASRIDGVGFDVIATESLRRHELGYPKRLSHTLNVLSNPGEYHWRAEGEKHVVNPRSIAQLQLAARTNSRDAYWNYARLVNEDSRQRCTLRGLMRLRDAKEDQRQPIPLDQVEPAKEIVTRFRTGAMSYGSLSKEAHESLAVAMNRIGGRSNSGEGGEDSARYVPDENGDLRRSAIKQIASGRFGVTSFYLTNGDVLQIKIAQGAKPGEGGQLPGHKVDVEIARVRHSTPGVGLISPPPHHDIYSIEDLAQLIYDLKNANPSADVSVKLVSEVGVGTVATGVSKAHADHILISGHDGGTGASPLTSIKHAGLPWELGLAETHQTLVMNDLRSRVRLEVDGGLRTGRDVVIGALLGAEEFGFSTAPLITLGCIMMRKCHLNTCPVGIATQDRRLRAKFSGKPEHVVNYLFMVAEEARQLMAQMGFATIDEMVGRVDMLETDKAIHHWKSDGLNLEPILKKAVGPRDDVQIIKTIEQDHGIDRVLDTKLIDRAEAALRDGQKTTLQAEVKNTDRAVGAQLSHHVSRRHGEEGLPDGTIHVEFTGNAGQSFGSWLARGITLELEGDANDYVGKGLSGGKVIVYPPKSARFKPEENIIIGNVALYGATAGEAYFRGIAAERFAVRNSGVHAVVEGVGDHGCEYMTGGRVVILGHTGRNFAAGMSGGVAYVWDQAGDFITRCNLGMVDLERVEADEDKQELKALVKAHLKHTGSTVAAHVLADFDTVLPQFVKVMPVDYRRVLSERRKVAKEIDIEEVEHG